MCIRDRGGSHPDQGRPEEDEELLRRRKQPPERHPSGSGNSGGVRRSQAFLLFQFLILRTFFSPPQAAAITHGGYGRRPPCRDTALPLSPPSAEIPRLPAVPGDFPVKAPGTTQTLAATETGMGFRKRFKIRVSAGHDGDINYRRGLRRSRPLFFLA